MYFSNAFSQSVACLILLTVSFSEQRYFAFFFFKLKFKLPILPFMDDAFGIIPLASRFSSVVFQESYNFMFYIYVYESLCVNFCEVCKICF